MPVVGFDEGRGETAVFVDVNAAIAEFLVAEHELVLAQPGARQLEAMIWGRPSRAAN